MREQRQWLEWILSCQRSLENRVGMRQASMLLPFLFAVVVDVVTEFAREGALKVLMYADYLVLMSETIKGNSNKFLIRKEAFESKGLKANLWKTKVMVGDGITKDGMSKSKVDPCGVYSLKSRLTQLCDYSVAN